jgi:hypothetical protein
VSLEELQQLVRDRRKVPLAWAGSTTKMNYLNFGDALSPVMVSLCSGLDVERIPSKSNRPRIGAVGTIGHGFEGGEVWFWGTGCSRYRNPTAPSKDRVLYEVPADTDIHIAATRGPISEKLLSGGVGGPGIYGDPVWLLPRFYRPCIEKRWELGVILHLSELTDRNFEPRFDPRYKRYEVPSDLVDDIRLISTVTPIHISALKNKLDEILSCKRIVSTSLHGMVIAESYGIPCLYFATARDEIGLGTAAADPDGDLDLRIVDLYAGLNRYHFPIYKQPRSALTNWEDILVAIDRAWGPTEMNADRLLEAFPLRLSPIQPPLGGSIFDDPVLRGLQLQHSVAELHAIEATGGAGGEKSG